LKAYADRNHPPFAHGFGRLDAFALIMNETFGTTLKRPDNYRPADAPVSYPDLWLTPELSWVQWNGSAANPFARNVGEVFGVFGHVNATLPSENGFASSVRGQNLYKLEQLVAKLKPPPWDEQLLGKIDREREKRGAGIYAKACASCHADKPPYPRTKPNQYGKSFIVVKMVPLAEIGTDPKMATNFATRVARPGVMGQPTDPPSPALSLLVQVVGQVVLREFKDLKLTPADQLAYSGFRSSAPPPNLLAYRAKPLAGVWATAPYLHNGSVPNLYQLLLPPAQRKRTFFVGSRKFDPKHVGLSVEKVAGAFLFDTGLPGNSNAGHMYGTDLTDEQRWDLLEYLKTL
jgi:mono/diheme cytochrome c family protein